MTSAICRPVPPRGFGIAQQLTMAAACAAALVTIATLAQASMKWEPAAAGAPSDRSAQCEHDGGIAMEALAANGLDLRTPKWRRDRQRAIRACRNGFSDLRWLNP